MNEMHREFGNVERLHELNRLEALNISHIEPPQNKRYNGLMILGLTSLVAITVILTLYNPTVFAGLGEIEKASMLFKPF